MGSFLAARLVIVGITLSALAACASPAEVSNMVVDQKGLVAAAPDSPFRGRVMIGKITGGEETNPLWTSQVGNAEFSEALRQSLDRSGLLSPPGDPGFILDAELASLNQPFLGFSMTVSSNVNYRVRESKNQKLWFHDSVAASYTATMSDSLIGVQRLRLANEGSVRENISTFIRKFLIQKKPID